MTSQSSRYSAKQKRKKNTVANAYCTIIHVVRSKHRREGCVWWVGRNHLREDTDMKRAELSHVAASGKAVRSLYLGMDSPFASTNHCFLQYDWFDRLLDTWKNSLKKIS